MQACLTNSAVWPDLPESWDYRYFFRDADGLGYSTCGVVRNTMAAVLRHYGQARRLESAWFESLKAFRSNPSALGFFVKQMCLSSISQNGLAVGEYNLGPMKTVVFPGEVPKIDIEEEPTLYVPARFNFPAIDAIIAKLEGAEVLLIPVQITIAGSHSDSEVNFFNNCARWAGQFDGRKVRWLFLWVLQQDTRKQMEEKKEEKKNLWKKTVGRPGYDCLTIAVGDVNQTVGEALMRARKASVSEGSAVGGGGSPSAHAKVAHQSGDSEEILSEQSAKTKISGVRGVDSDSDNNILEEDGVGRVGACAKVSRAMKAHGGSAAGGNAGEGRAGGARTRAQVARTKRAHEESSGKERLQKKAVKEKKAVVAGAQRKEAKKKRVVGRRTR